MLKFYLYLSQKYRSKSVHLLLYIWMHSFISGRSNTTYSFWSKKKNSGSPSAGTLGMCCSSAGRMHSPQMSSFCFSLCCTRVYPSCHQLFKGPTSWLWDRLLSHQATGTLAALETAPATTQSLTLFTSSHRLGGFAMRGFMTWGPEELARGAMYAGDSEPSAGSYSTGAWEILKSKTQPPSLYSSSGNCITHFPMIHFLCLATVKHLNCLMTLAMH